MNEWLGIIFVFNDLVKMSGNEEMTPEEKKELDAKTVRDPTTWTIARYDGPNHLGFWYNALPSIKWP